MLQFKVSESACFKALNVKCLLGTLPKTMQDKTTNTKIWSGEKSWKDNKKNTTMKCITFEIADILRCKQLQSKRHSCQSKHARTRQQIPQQIFSAKCRTYYNATAMGIFRILGSTWPLRNIKCIWLRLTRTFLLPLNLNNELLSFSAKLLWRSKWLSWPLLVYK